MMKSIHPQVIEFFNEEKARLSDEVCEALEELIFENRYTLHPRRIKELGPEEVDGFAAYLSGGKDEQAVEEWGGLRAQEGVGVKAPLALGVLLRRVFVEAVGRLPVEAVRAAVRAVDAYMSAYLAGFMKVQEKQILQDQEQLRKALADALEQQRQELFLKNHAIHTSINGIILTDMHGAITYVNPAFLKMWGYETSEELVGTSSVDFFGEDRSRGLYAADSRTEGWHAESTVRRRDGSSTDVEVSASLIRDTSGAPVGVMASFVDITERKRLESQFRQAQKMDALGQLAGGIVHDVNNLLTAISGYAQLELMDLPPDMPVRRSLSQIKTATDRGKSLTQQLRVFTRQATGERRSINLNDLVDETRELIRRTFPPNIAIVLNLEPNLKPINADPSQMSQLLMNLCVNARDAMAAGERGGGDVSGFGNSGGRLTVVTSNVRLDQRAAARYLTAKPGDYVCVKVSDTGVGMPPEVLERLFEPFFTTKGERTGTGLGLAVVYGTVQNHSGFIDVKSSAGLGSIFEVYLPVADRTIAAAAVEDFNAALVPGEGTVMVVEDEVQVRGVVVETLQKCGYEVIAAENGVEALVLFEGRRKPIDLVVLDMIMPRMNGWDCFHRLKEIEPGVKVLVMTGYTASASPEQLLKEGAVGFIEKPINLQPFTQAVRDGVRRAPGRRKTSKQH